VVNAYPAPIKPLPYSAYGETESNLFCTVKGLDAAKLKG
jgi:urea transport system substrate-binding protein